MQSAGLDVEDVQGETALECAVRARQPRAMAFLLLHGATIKAKYAVLQFMHKVISWLDTMLSAV